MCRMSTQSLRAPDSGSQWQCELQTVFSVLVLDSAPLPYLHTDNRSCQLASLEGGLSHDAVPLVAHGEASRWRACYFAPWELTTMQGSYSVSKVNVHGLGVVHGTDEG